MTKLQAALLDIVSFLEQDRIPYMVIGGFANLHWGVERLTRDLDITVEVAEEALDAWLGRLERRFRILVADPQSFARRNNLVRVSTRTEVPVDLILAALPYELAAIRRAAEVRLGARTVRICSAEDLIIHKLASERLQDAADVEGVIQRQHAKLDRNYLDRKVRELAAGLERPQILSFYRDCLSKAGLPTAGLE